MGAHERHEVTHGEPHVGEAGDEGGDGVVRAGDETVGGDVERRGASDECVDAGAAGAGELNDGCEISVKGTKVGRVRRRGHQQAVLKKIYWRKLGFD